MWHINFWIYRLIAVDGSHLYINENLVTSGVDFKLVKHGNHYEGFISGMYDVLSEWPINYTICNHTDERKALLGR